MDKWRQIIKKLLFPGGQRIVRGRSSVPGNGMPGKVDAHGADGQEHGGHFSDDQAGRRDGNGQLSVLLQGGKGDQVDASHPHKLFHELCGCGNGGLAQTVKVAVDTGMNGGEGEGKSRDAQQRRTAGLKKKPLCYEVGAAENNGRA